MLDKPLEPDEREPPLVPEDGDPPFEPDDEDEEEPLPPEETEPRPAAEPELEIPGFITKSSPIPLGSIENSFPRGNAVARRMLRRTRSSRRRPVGRWKRCIMAILVIVW